MVVNTNNEQLKYKGTQKEMESVEKQQKQEQRLNDVGFFRFFKVVLMFKISLKLTMNICSNSEWRKWKDKINIANHCKNRV